MCTFFLIRHAAHAGAPDRLLGRMPGVTLSRDGRVQADAIAALLSTAQLTAIHSSPRQRALETAFTIGQAQQLNVSICDALDELDYGDWTGANFASLGSDPAWRQWNETRSLACPPHGEFMQAVQKRIVAHLEQVAENDPSGTIAIVTHAEPIRAALLHAHGLSLDAWRRFDIPFAGVTRLRIRKAQWDTISQRGAQAA